MADIVEQQLFISPRVDPFSRAPYSCEIAQELQQEVISQKSTHALMSCRFPRITSPIERQT